MGKLVFLDLVDRSGRIQLLCPAARTGEVDVHLGDIVGVDRQADEEPARRAVAGRRRARAALAQSARRCPDTFHGLTDVEQRYRRRYLDLLMNEEMRADFMLRARIVTAIRRYLDDEGFVEVETPILQPRYGGAFAEPFVDAPQRARPGPLPAHRDRALPQAADRRRPREGLRDRQGLPQRGRLVQAQPRVHDARVVRGVRRLPGHDGADGEPRRARRARERSARRRSTFRGHEIDLKAPWKRVQARRRARRSSASGRRDYDDLQAASRVARHRRLARQDVGAARRQGA